MSGEVGEISIKATLDGQDFNLGVEQMKSLMAGVVRESKDASSQIGSFFKSTISTALGMLGANGVAGLGSAVMGSISGLELAEVNLKSLMGSAEEAKDKIEEMKRMGADTPYEVNGLIDATVMLKTSGVATSDLTTMVEALGNAAGGSQEKLGQLANVLGQTKMQGVALTQDIRQFTTAGVPMLDLLAKQYNTNTESISKMVETGKIGYPQLKKALEDYYTGTGQYAGRMEEASKTISGLWSTAKDDMLDMARGLAGNVIPEVKSFIGGISSAVKWFKSLSDSTKSSMVSVLAMTGTIILLVKAFSSWGVITATVIKNIEMLKVALTAVSANPIMAVVAALAILSAAFAEPIAQATLFRKEMADLEEAHKQTIKVNAAAVDSILKYSGHMKDHIATFKKSKEENYAYIESQIKFIDKVSRAEGVTAKQREALRAVRKELSDLKDGYDKSTKSSDEFNKKQSELAKKLQEYADVYVDTNRDIQQQIYDNNNKARNKELEEYSRYNAWVILSMEDRGKAVAAINKKWNDKTEREIEDSNKDIIQSYGFTYRQMQQFGESSMSVVANTFATMSNTVADGSKTFKEAMKEMLMTLLTTVETEIIMNMLRSAAYAAGLFIPTMGASAVAGAAQNAILGGLLVTIEGMKAGIRKMAKGGLAVKPTYAQIAEGEDDEAVLPLNKYVFSQLAQGIIDNLQAPVTQSSESRQALTESIGGYSQRQDRTYVTSSNLVIGNNKMGKIITKVCDAGYATINRRVLTGAPA